MTTRFLFFEALAADCGIIMNLKAWICEVLVMMHRVGRPPHHYAHLKILQLIQTLHNEATLTGRADERLNEIDW